MKSFVKKAAVAVAGFGTAAIAAAQEVAAPTAAQVTGIMTAAQTAANTAMTISLGAVGFYGVVRFVKWIRK